MRDHKDKSPFVICDVTAGKPVYDTHGQSMLGSAPTALRTAYGLKVPYKALLIDSDAEVVTQLRDYVFPPQELLYCCDMQQACTLLEEMDMCGNGIAYIDPPASREYHEKARVTATALSVRTKLDILLHLSPISAKLARNSNPVETERALQNYKAVVTGQCFQDRHCYIAELNRSDPFQWSFVMATLDHWANAQMFGFHTVSDSYCIDTLLPRLTNYQK